MDSGGRHPDSRPPQCGSVGSVSGHGSGGDPHSAFTEVLDVLRLMHQRLEGQSEIELLEAGNCCLDLIPVASELG